MAGYTCYVWRSTEGDDQSGAERVSGMRIFLFLWEEQIRFLIKVSGNQSTFETGCGDDDWSSDAG